MSADTSRSLLDRLQTANNAQDWVVFCKIYQPFIRRHLLARSIQTKDVDDVGQEILSRVFRAIPTFTHNGRRGAFRKWLGKIVSQQTWRYFQKLQNEVAVSLVESERFEAEFSTPDELEQQWESEHDQYLIGRLLELIKPEFTETTWRAFQLVAVRSLPSEDAAQQLNISVNAVVIAKSRVLRRLQILGKNLIDIL